MCHKAGRKTNESFVLFAGEEETKKLFLCYSIICVKSCKISISITYYFYYY
jgi:hypothetical protein